MIEHDFGTEDHWHSYTTLFGNRHGSVAFFREKYPHLKFLRVKQVHGDRIVHATAETTDLTIEADALISNLPNLALCSISADCVPVLIASAESGWFAAIHSGWRGVAARIVPKTIEALIEKQVPVSDLKVWIGPHLLQDSFEVDADVRDMILQSLPPAKLVAEIPVAQWPANPAQGASVSIYCEQVEGGKSLISLVQILIEQIRAMGLALKQIEMELEDTKTSESFHSFRRDREKSGRQVSWIAKIPD